jgi:hypothetical protein
VILPNLFAVKKHINQGEITMKLSTKLATTLIVSTIFFTTSGYAEEVMQAEFQTMASCLSSIKNSSGQELKIITDKPDEVSGFLSNGKGFACQKKETGTKGTYFEGWYMVD